MRVEQGGPDLRETIRTLHEQAAARRRRAERARTLPQGWREAVDALLQRVEHVYLLEFLIFKVIEVTRVDVDVFLPGFGRVALGALRIGIGDRTVMLSPEARFDRPDRVTMRLADMAGTEDRQLYCDLFETRPRWMGVRRETGLRRLLEPYLPEKAVELDEPVFRGLLDACLRAPEPVFLKGLPELRDGFGHMLDFVTAEHTHRRLATGLRVSAGEVGRQVAGAAPALKRSLKGAGPRQLLLGWQGRRAGPSAPEAEAGAQGEGGPA